ncbi:hypothetical protein [Chryseobacterium mulctrae]|uniref:hypothetical protein n=1 Tax=Chryseobacterium mulctrae TaxID=2576777 RepID=UPI001117A3FC|nr:hypothetical protein [Chryseobacterium mulctrae]
MRNLILPFILLLTFVFSCTSNDIDEGLGQKTTSYDVYVAGSENNKASFWKNNVLNNLAGGDNLNAEKIIVENNNTYILGNSNGVNPNYYFWKNNTKEDLRVYLGIPTLSPYQILDMAIDNGDNYFIGYYDTFSPIAPLRYEFCIWKNGVKTVLNTSNNIIYRTSKINIFNHQTYVSAITNNISSSFQSGYYIGTTFHSIPNISWVCNFSQNSMGINFLYIKSGLYYYRNLTTNIETLVSNNNYPNLFEGKIISETNSSDLYIAGSLHLGNSYFKNNIQTVFPIDPTYSRIKDMFVLDNNLYTIKHQITPNSSKVYINNIETQNITNTSTSTNNTFNSIYVVQN